MNKAFETVRNVYVTPQVVFEELEADETLNQVEEMMILRRTHWILTSRWTL